jgi:hypothetical protein
LLSEESNINLGHRSIRIKYNILVHWKGLNSEVAVVKFMTVVLAEEFGLPLAQVL